MRYRIVIFVCCLCVSFLAIAQHERIERNYDTQQYDISSFNLNQAFYSDTLLDNVMHFQDYYFNSRFGGIRSGNNGQAYLPFSYFEQKRNSTPFFLIPFEHYLTHTLDVEFYDARKPFSRFDFVMGPDGYEDVMGLVSLNASPFLNFGLKYHSTKTEGAFINSGGKLKDFSLWQSYTKKRYENHFSLVYNRVAYSEFGGFLNDSLYDNNASRIENMDVNLPYASNEIRNLEGRFSHEFKLGEIQIDTTVVEEDTVVNINHIGKFTLFHRLQVNRAFKVYSDDAKQSFDSGYYTNIYLDSVNTYDSTAQMSISNLVGVKYRQNIDSVKSVNIFLGVENEFYKMHYAMCESNYNNINLMFKVDSDPKSKLFYAADFRYGIYGRNISNVLSNTYAHYSLDSANINQLSYCGQYSYRKPEYFMENFYSNNFKWCNIFDNETKLISEFSYFNREYKFNFFINHAYLNKNIFINTEGLPQQAQSDLSILNTGLGKTFRVGAFGIDTKFSYQYLSNYESVRLPEIMLYGGLFFQKLLFDNALNLRVGVDASSASSYFSYKYIPSTSLFAIQDVRKTSGQPIIDFYVSFKVKRFRAFVNYTNIGQEFFGINSYSLLHYPDRPSGVYFGFTWEFYD